MNSITEVTLKEFASYVLHSISIKELATLQHIKYITLGKYESEMVNGDFKKQLMTFYGYSEDKLSNVHIRVGLANQTVQTLTDLNEVLFVRKVDQEVIRKCIGWFDDLYNCSSAVYKLPTIYYEFDCKALLLSRMKLELVGRVTK